MISRFMTGYRSLTSPDGKHFFIDFVKPLLPFDHSGWAASRHFQATVMTSVILVFTWRMCQIHVHIERFHRLKAKINKNSAKPRIGDCSLSDLGRSAIALLFPALLRAVNTWLRRLRSQDLLKANRINRILIRRMWFKRKKRVFTQIDHFKSQYPMYTVKAVRLLSFHRVI